jgi:hypothetical protein
MILLPFAVSIPHYPNSFVICRVDAKHSSFRRTHVSRSPPEEDHHTIDIFGVFLKFTVRIIPYLTREELSYFGRIARRGAEVYSFSFVLISTSQLSWTVLYKYRSKKTYCCDKIEVVVFAVTYVGCVLPRSSSIEG